MIYNKITNPKMNSENNNNINNDVFDIENDQYIEKPWDVLGPDRRLRKF